MKDALVRKIRSLVPEDRAAVHGLARCRDAMHRHFVRWEKLYQIGGVVAAVTISAYGATVSAHSIKVAQRALSLQEVEHELRVRPYINIMFPQFTRGTRKSDSGFHQNKVAIVLANLSESPATEIQFVMAHVGSNMAFTNYPTGGTFIMKDDPQSWGGEVPMEFFSNLTNQSYSLHVSVQYKGLLKTNVYKARAVFAWRPEISDWESTARDFQ